MTDFSNERDRGAKAAAILREPMVTEAFTEIRAAYVDAWSLSDPSDTAYRERLFYLMKAMEAFEGHFSSAVQTGKLASQQLDELRK